MATKETRSLLVALTVAEKADKAAKLQTKLAALDAKRTEINADVASMKTELKVLEREIDTLRTAIITGTEYRDVQCTLTEVTAVEVKRDDTNEVIGLQPKAVVKP